MTGCPGNTEERLRDALDTLAEGVQASPDAYRRARARWRRRERRRRLVLAILAAVVFALADGIGLWALNHARPNAHIIFDDSGRTEQRPIGRVGQP